MSNNNQYQNNNRKYDQNMFSPQQLVEGLDQTSIPLNRNGSLFLEQTYDLEAKFESLIGDTFGISEIDHVMIYPSIDRMGTLQDIVCVAYFNTQGVGNGDITRNGNNNNNRGNSPQNIADLAGLPTTNFGGFRLSDKFKSIMLPLVRDDNNNNKINVKALPQNKAIASIELDFNSLLGAALAVDSKTPYNFSVISASPINSDGKRYSNCSVLIAKFIDVNGRKGRSNKFDYRSVDRAYIDRFYGQGNKHSNNNGGRSFN